MHEVVTVVCKVPGAWTLELRHPEYIHIHRPLHVAGWTWTGLRREYAPLAGYAGGRMELRRTVDLGERLAFHRQLRFRHPRGDRRNFPRLHRGAGYPRRPNRAPPPPPLPLPPPPN